ncbi:calmodulin-binding protein 60 B isoform X2 [Canna indica]|uniref:Calmodulin-binding protein 60 B isoform X2 n=1 Tax=Canna indica TaxID=4628 RepID=A0AAQ3L1I6_9LILI|nr:calmodulin-binding protein 60 B isoform X2 [Canna indica]
MFTGENIEGENGAAIHILLLDGKTGQPVNSEPESSAKLIVVALDGDFDYEDDGNWTEDEFKKHVVKGRKDKKPLLAGDLQVSLRNGVGTLGKLSFTDNSKWTRCGKFRLGLKVGAGCCNGIRVREAKTQAFVVKEGRGQLYKKHHPPALDDEIWRLESIAKDGPFRKKLNENNVQTVGDFLKFLVKDGEELRKTLGMSVKKWNKLVAHANTAVLNYICYLDETKNVGAIFNHERAFYGLIQGDQFVPAECLNDSHQKTLAGTLIDKAYGNWNDVTKYDGKDVLEFIKRERAATASSSVYYQQNPQLDHLKASVPNLEQYATAGDVPSAAVYSNPPLRNEESNTHFTAPVIADFNNGTEFTAPVVAEGDVQFDPFSHAEQQPNQSACSDDFLANIRSISHEFLESDKMQNVLNDWYRDDSFHPELDLSWWSNSEYFKDDSTEQNHAPRRAAVGWVKITTITAALRWAFFIRRRAADRKRSAELVELED